MHANKTERGIAHPHVFESLFCQRVYYFLLFYCCYMRENSAARARLLPHLLSHYHTCTLWATRAPQRLVHALIT